MVDSMHPYISVLCLLLPLMFVPASGRAQAELPERFRLARLEFQGVHSLSPAVLERNLAGRQPPLWKFWVPGPILEPRDLEMDRQRIEQVYRSEGFYQAEATFKPVRVGGTADPNRAQTEARDTVLPAVAVVFEISEGPPVRVDRLELSWDRSIESIDSQALKAALPVQTDRRFRVEDYEAAKQKVRFLLADRGFPFATVGGRAVVDLNRNRADVFLEIDTGPRSTFGAVRIDQPPTGTDETVLRRALTFREGDLWSAGKLETSRRNLLQLNVYQSVIFERGPAPEEDGGPVPLTLNLTPRQGRSLQLGIGYGTEDRLRLRAALTWRNMFQKAGQLTLSARRSSLVETLQLQYRQPYFLEARNTLDARGGVQQEDLAAYKTREAFNTVSLTRRFLEDWSWKADYGLAYTRLDELKVNAPQDAEQLAADRYTLVSAVTGEVVRDTRDDLLNPNEGIYMKASAQLASEVLGSEIEFVAPAFEARAYRTLFDGWVLAGRLRWETVEEIGDTDFIPIFERLFLGGSYTVRGYAFQELPPLDPDTQNPLGGQTALNANLELRFPVYGKLTGTVFMDAGQVDPEPFHVMLDEVRYAAGGGLRYDTVIGPLRLDFGYKLNPPTRSDIGAFTNPGAEIGDRWRIHLNIGQTF
jgi:outer membrane protein assembly complex protein YaeT